MRVSAFSVVNNETGNPLRPPAANFAPDRSLEYALILSNSGNTHPTRRNQRELYHSWRPSRNRQAHVADASCLFATHTFRRRCGYASNVMPVFFRNAPTHLVDPVHRIRIVKFCRHFKNSSFRSKNSPGVMMTGHAYPSPPIIIAVFGNVTGFAMCLQFQVSRARPCRKPPPSRCVTHPFLLSPGLHACRATSRPSLRLPEYCHPRIRLPACFSRGGQRIHLRHILPRPSHTETHRFRTSAQSPATTATSPPV